MNAKDLKQLAGLLKQFRDWRDAEGTETVKTAKAPESAMRRQRVLDDVLHEIDFVARLIDAKIRAVEPPKPETKEQVHENQNDQ